MSNLWDRQEYALGQDSTSKIHNSNLMIEYNPRNTQSCSMLVELTKNLILLGFTAIALVAIEEGDLSTSHFDVSILLLFLL